MQKLIALVVLCLGLVACVQPSPEQQAAAMPLAQRVLVVDLGEPVPATDLRIAGLDAQLRVAAERFGITPELAGDQAVVAAREIRASGQDASAPEVLSGVLAVTKDMSPVPPSAEIIALYAHVRITGSRPEVAVRVTEELWNAASR